MSHSNVELPRHTTNLPIKVSLTKNTLVSTQEKLDDHIILLTTIADCPHCLAEYKEKKSDFSQTKPVVEESNDIPQSPI